MSLYNQNYTAGFLLGMLILTNTAFSMNSIKTLKKQSTAMEQPEALGALLKKSQSPEKRQEWINLVQKLYRRTFALYVDEEDLPDSYEGLKTLFTAFNLTPYNWPDQPKWTEQKWKDAYTELSSFSGRSGNPVIALNEVPAVLEVARTLVKSFLPTDDREISSITSNFIQKSLNPHLIQNVFIYSFNRLFTYSYLNLIIQLEKLNHVKLPRKVLLIQNKETKEYLSTEEAKKIIDDTLKFSVLFIYRDEVNGQIFFDSDKYELKFFAHREATEGEGLSILAKKELEILCNRAPFDIGYDNIFWDTKGNAIIIDTEYKGEYASSTCFKLDRYPVDPSL